MFSLLCFVFSLYETGLDGAYCCSRTSCYVYGAFYITYHLLDNIDGKQARNLKLSTPLGFFMDHNLDSFSLICLSLAATNVVHFDTSLKHLCLYISTALPFYVCTWEEYTTGHLEIPILSGVDEGAYITSSIFIITGYVTNEFWDSIYLYGIDNRTILLAIACSFGIILAFIR